MEKTIANETTDKVLNSRIYNGAKRASSINGAGKTGQLHVKNKIRLLPNSLQKDKLKMD